MATNITPSHSPFSYFRPWKENNNAFDSYLDYIRDVSLAKYTADTVGSYIQDASSEQINAINEVGGKIQHGFSLLSSGLSEISSKLDTTNENLFFVNQNLNLIYDQQRITNLLLSNIADLLRVPDQEKQRYHHIELGLKFFSNTRINEDLFSDALEEFLAAESLMKQDYFVLHRIGLIYLYSKKYLDPHKALEYFKKAAKYASVETHPNAKRLVSIMRGKVTMTEGQSEDSIQWLTATSYEKAAFAAYVIGDFSEAVILAEKAKSYFPSVQNLFMLSKYQVRNNQVPTAIFNLKQAIEILPDIVYTIFLDIDLMNEPEVLTLVNTFNQSLFNEIKKLTTELQNTKVQELGDNFIYKDKSILKLTKNVNKYLEGLNESLKLDYPERLEFFTNTKKEISTSEKLKVGDQCGGGTVFYIDDSGTKGLVAAEKEIGEGKWGRETILGTSTILWSGKNNSTIIAKNELFKRKSFFSRKMEACVTAAALCQECRINNREDWFLPSKDELTLLYSVRELFEFNKGLIKKETSTFTVYGREQLSAPPNFGHLKLE